MLRAAYTDGIAIFAQKAIGVVVYPFQKVAAEISSGVTNMLQGYLRTEQLQEENEQLKEEIRQLLGFLSRMQQNMEMQEVTRSLQFLRVRIFPCQI